MNDRGELLARNAKEELGDVGLHGIAVDAEEHDLTGDAGELGLTTDEEELVSTGDDAEDGLAGDTEAHGFSDEDDAISPATSSSSENGNVKLESLSVHDCSSTEDFDDSGADSDADMDAVFMDSLSFVADVYQ